jgi:hypothetical protein
VTSFEIAVLVTCLLYAVTNTVGLSHHPRLAEMPRWYIALVLLLAAGVVGSFINVICGVLL